MKKLFLLATITLLIGASSFAQASQPKHHKTTMHKHHKHHRHHHHMMNQHNGH